MKYWRKCRDLVVTILLWLFCLVTVGFLLWILADLVLKGLPHVTLAFITSEYNVYKGLHGIAPMLITTLWIICITILISMPVGVFTAICLVEYSKSELIVKPIRFATENLAGIPSIIYGLFGYIFFKNILGLGFSILSASLTLTIMILPSVTRTVEEAILSVDSMYREGSMALGATKLYTVFHMIIPCVAPQIISAMLLTIGRVIGETAAVYFTAGTVYRFPEGIMSSGRTLSVHMYILAKETGNFNEAYATACLLIFCVAIVQFFVNRINPFMRNKTGV